MTFFIRDKLEFWAKSEILDINAEVSQISTSGFEISGAAISTRKHVVVCLNKNVLKKYLYCLKK